MSIRIVGLDHVVLRVRDLQRALSFYCDVLGLTEERRLESIGLVQLRAGAALVDLVDAGSQCVGEAWPPEQRNMDHFCLQLESFDGAAIRAQLQSHGIDCSEAEQRYGAGGMGLSIYLQDPDGNTLELRKKG